MVSMIVWTDYDFYNTCTWILMKLFTFNASYNFFHIFTRFHDINYKWIFIIQSENKQFAFIFQSNRHIPKRFSLPYFIRMWIFLYIYVNTKHQNYTYIDLEGNFLVNNGSLMLKRTRYLLFCRLGFTKCFTYYLIKENLRTTLLDVCMCVCVCVFYLITDSI